MKSIISIGDACSLSLSACWIYIELNWASKFDCRNAQHFWSFQTLVCYHRLYINFGWNFGILHSWIGFCVGFPWQNFVFVCWFDWSFCRFSNIAYLAAELGSSFKIYHLGICCTQLTFHPLTEFGNFNRIRLKCYQVQNVFKLISRAFSLVVCYVTF